MDKCICNSCINLKPEIGEDGDVSDYVCKFGWPDEGCSECAGDECSVVCSNYISDEAEPEATVCHCAACGKELEMVTGDQTEGEVYCLDCYLKNNL